MALPVYPAARGVPGGVMGCRHAEPLALLIPTESARRAPGGCP